MPSLGGKSVTVWEIMEGRRVWGQGKGLSLPGAGSAAGAALVPRHGSPWLGGVALD